jgi:hypothetical protein
MRSYATPGCNNSGNTDRIAPCHWLAMGCFYVIDPAQILIDDQDEKRLLKMNVRFIFYYAMALKTDN